MAASSMIFEKLSQRYHQGDAESSDDEDLPSATKDEDLENRRLCREIARPGSQDVIGQRSQERYITVPTACFITLKIAQHLGSTNANICKLWI